MTNSMIIQHSHSTHLVEKFQDVFLVSCEIVVGRSILLLVGIVDDSLPGKLVVVRLLVVLVYMMRFQPTMN